MASRAASGANARSLALALAALALAALALASVALALTLATTFATAPGIIAPAATLATIVQAHDELAASEIGAVQIIDGGLRGLGAVVSHDAEAPRATILASFDISTAFARLTPARQAQESHATAVTLQRRIYTTRLPSVECIRRGSDEGHGAAALESRALKSFTCDP